MTTATEVKFKITNGPAFEGDRSPGLLDSLRPAETQKGRKTVFFNLSLWEKMSMPAGIEILAKRLKIGLSNLKEGSTFVFEARIDKLEWEDGSGNSWNLKGDVKPGTRDAGPEPREIFAFKAYYNSKLRSGTLTITELR